ncbi:MAG: hypothetical protein ACPGLV_07055, partial [Bacteroidia bacterium]
MLSEINFKLLIFKLPRPDSVLILKIESGVIKKIIGQGTAAAITGAAQDVGANLMGSEQNMG